MHSHLVITRLSKVMDRSWRVPSDRQVIINQGSSDVCSGSNMWTTEAGPTTTVPMDPGPNGSFQR